jgi:cytochrome P450
MSEAFEFDPFDPRFFADPFPAWRRLRADHPVYRRAIERPRVWPHYFMLSRAKDVNDALADWKTFSSARGTLVDTDVSLIPPNIFHMDPPRHDELRGLLARALTPKRVRELEPRVRACASEILASLASKGGFDAATEYAQLIPTLTMCELMDLPKSERATFLAWNHATLGSADFTSEAALRAYGQMASYWRELVAERRKRTTTDLISQLLTHQAGDPQLTDDEVSGFCSLLLDASQNTTMNMISQAILALAQFPGERRKLVAAPARWPQALEEILRFVSPVAGLARATTRDVTLHGVEIAAGDQVLLLYGSANHDETVFEDPDVLDLDRDVRSHWTFGHGIHHCLGSAVARLETRVALEVLTARIPEWEVDEAEVVRTQLVPTRGIAHLPIRFAPAA